MTSQNGWPLINATQLDTGTIPGTDVVPIPGLLKGDVAWLLKWVGTQFNSRVAKLYSPGCWGWNAPTPIPGSSMYSNHCSGTAIDFNAPSFPWKFKTMTAAQRQACRVIVNQTDSVVAWGGDFTTIVDEMHFEINGTAEDVKNIVSKLKGEDMAKIDLFTARRLAYGILGDHTALTGARDADLKKNHVGKELTPLYIQTLFDCKEATASRIAADKLVQPGVADKQLAAVKAALGVK